MGNIVNVVKRFSHNNADDIPFQRCSCGDTSRLDKCTCGDNDSSVTGKTASAINCTVNECKAFGKEVGNEGMDLTAGSSPRSGCFTLSVAHTEPSGGEDEANKDRETLNDIIHTDAIEEGAVNRYNHAGLICNQTADHMSHNLEDGSTEKIRSLTGMIYKDLFSTVSPKENSCTDTEIAKDLENCLARDTDKSKELRLHKVSPASNLFDGDAYEKLIDRALNLGCKSIAEASVNNAMVPYEDRAACATLDVKGCESTSKASLKRRAKRKRTNCKASNQMMAPNENIRTLSPSDVKFPEMVRSPVTRSKAMVLSVSTPESLKLRSSRSGRLIVPRLDPGTQNIIYDADGSICGVASSELQRPQGCDSVPPAKRRRSRCSSPGRGRLLLF